VTARTDTSSGASAFARAQQALWNVRILPALKDEKAMDAMPNRRNSIALWTLLAATVAFGGRSADAAAMNKTLHARSQQSAEMRLARYTRAEEALAPYYAYALQTHQLRVFIPRVLRNIQSEQGLLHESSFVAYLEWRRSLAPRRFDHYHPRLAKAIITDTQIRQSLVDTPPVTPPTNVVPAPGGVTPPTDVVIPPTVSAPEPSTALIALVLIGAGLWARRRNGALGRG
jgi:hypothetical protein